MSRPEVQAFVGHAAIASTMKYVTLSNEEASAESVPDDCGANPERKV